MKSEPFTGTVSAMKTSVWLASEDLLGLPDAKVTIAGVHKHEDVPMDGGRKEPKLFAISFEGREKQMILNATNRNTCLLGYDRIRIVPLFLVLLACFSFKMAMTLVV